MQLLRSLVGLALALALTPYTGHTQLRLLSDCGSHAACVPMTIDLVGHERVDPLTAPDSLWFATFSVPVMGRLGGGPVAKHELLVRGYVGGMECSAFGQASTAVVGHSEKGHPILVTEGGMLEVTDSIFRVGCPECGRVVDTSTGLLVATHRTPGWDLTLVNTQPDSLMVSANGELVIHRLSSWIQLTHDGPFRSLTERPAAGGYRLELQFGACT